MSRVKIYLNPVDAKECLHVRTDDVVKLFTEIKKKHSQARIYLKPACAQNDVTPSTHIELASLQELAKTNDFDISVHAGEPATIIAIVSLVISLGLTLYTYLNQPSSPEGAQGSPNNELSRRANRERINGRVPDIFGRVKAVPDLVAPPLMYYQDDGIEVEECLMCLGRGEYDISDIKDGDTFGSTIEGFSTSIYAPGTSLTGTPQVQVGAGFTGAPLIGKKSAAITGQTLPGPTTPVLDTAIEGTMYPQYPNRLYLVGGGLDAVFSVGESIVIDSGIIGVADAPLSGSTNVEMAGIITIGSSTNITNPNDFKSIQIDTLLVSDATNGILDLAGNYDVVSIIKSGSYAYEIQLQSPVSVNPNWSLLTADNVANSSTTLTNNINSIDISGEYPSISVVTSDYIELDIPVGLQAEWDKLNGLNVNSATIEIQKYTDNWIGWFYINARNIEQIVFSFYFPQGLFSIRTDGKQAQMHSSYTIEYQAIDGNNPIGPIHSVSDQVIYQRTDPFGMSNFVTPESELADGVRFRVRKTSYNTANRSAVYDDLKIKSVYACSYLDKLIYPDVTMLRTKMIATDGALSVKERLWNCIATRKVYTYESGSQSGSLVPSRNFADIVCALHTDKYIGRRMIETLDVDNLYATSAAIESYFGTEKAAEFNYTFDQWNESYEQSLGIVAAAVNSNARRENSKIYFQFERENPSSAILFNHRNKVPYSETRTEKFGINRDFDGVEAKWINPENGWVEETLRIPNDNITNPKKFDMLGVVNYEQAHFIAHRAWNKIRYQKDTVQFTAYGEGELVTINDRIAVTDDTIPQVVSSGDVVAWENTNIRISQPANLDPAKNYIAHLQLKNRTVETIPVTQGLSEYELILDRVPTLPLVIKTEYDEYAKYSITLDTESESEAFIVTEKTVNDHLTSEITAVNYDSRYYANDTDLINELI